MSNDSNLPAIATTDDGWADTAAEAAERVLRGTLLKFSDRVWSVGKEGTPLQDGRQLVALSTASAWVKWADGKPAEYHMKQPGEPLPEREELGELDKAAWETGPDGITPRDPWQQTRFVYLVDPNTAEAFTFSTSSWGGRNAVIDLADQIARMRYAHPAAVPVVELAWLPMVTKFGKKSKPLFRVVSWKKGDFNEREAAQIEDNKYATAKGRATSMSAAMDDEIPF
jgi:hypothetical protein